MKNVAKGIALSLFLLVLLTGCAVNPVTGEKELMFISESQEIEMGESLYPNALWGAEGGGGEYRDEELKAYLNGIILKIHGASHRPHLPIDFAIQNSSVPNAWAIPGHVVITRGLLAGLDNEAQFAFVMGHEVGHVSARHSAKQVSMSILQGIALGATGVALSGTSYGDAAVGLGYVGSSLVLLKYSRGDELESDRLGILYMTKLGYDPENAVSAHERLEEISNEYLRSLGKEPGERGAFEELLSTHPRTSVRIDEIREMIEKVKPFTISGDGTGRAVFQGKISSIKKTSAVYLDYYDPAVRAFGKNRLGEADNLIARAIELDPGQPPFHALKGFIELGRKNYPGAEKSFHKAVSLEPDYEPARRGLGIANYREKDYREAIRDLEKALDLFPDDTVARFYLGASYYGVREYRKAIPHLKAFSEAQPRHPEVHGLLGISYENTGEIRLAYNSYLRQVQVAPDNEMGRYAKRRVEALRGRQSR